MTEAEWLACGEVMVMLRSVPHPISPRKLRLFAVACWRHAPLNFEGSLNTEFEHRLEVAERYADERADDEEVTAVYLAGPLAFGNAACVPDAATAAWQSVTDSVALPKGFFNIVKSRGLTALPATGGGDVTTRPGFFGRLRRAFLGDPAPPPSYPPEILSQETRQCILLYDIIGNPFRPVTFSPQWRTDTAVALARQMYESRDFSALPILADALQDAECDNADILSHCREPGLHVRGCWVVDLVLGKE